MGTSVRNIRLAKELGPQWHSLSGLGRSLKGEWGDPLSECISRATRTTRPTRTESRSTRSSARSAEHGSDYGLDEGRFDEAADQAAANAPEVAQASASEAEQFRAGLEAHWGGNLPALWAYLNRIDPAGGSKPGPPGEGEAPHWEPDDDYDGFGNLIESAEQERERLRHRAEQELAQLARR